MPPPTEPHPSTGPTDWRAVATGADVAERLIARLGQTHRLHHQASERGAAALRGNPLPPDQCEQRRRTAVEQNLIDHASEGRRWMRGGHSFWRAEELALLGTVPDVEVAPKTGRTVNEVRLKREKVGLPNPEDRRRK